MCHKPGIVGYLLEAKNGEWRSYGQFLFNAGLAGVNTFSASREGDFFIEFEDGVKYRLGCPNLNISNLIMGQHAMNVLSGHSYIEDLTNKICADVHYNPWEDASYSGMFKKAFKWGVGKMLKGEDPRQKTKRSDDIQIAIYQR